jgi:hypothetical protein
MEEEFQVHLNGRRRIWTWRRFFSEGRRMLVQQEEMLRV